ncbi:MAG TPA: hypothetical protein VFP19_08200 [Candidatus Limnocylindrales bacterium]|nr:hypothetical protein [Candidatus Limnocylindrales bacterium]
MQIPFTAYADDCTVTGEVAMTSDRLSDFLAGTEEFEVDAAAFRALDDGRVVEMPSAAILRDDLCVVAASGPRGRPERRLWTRQYPVRARIGPYVVLGYLHAPPTIDPLRTADRRTIVALTSSVVEYDLGGELQREVAEAVLVNRAKIDVLEPATDADLGIARSPELLSKTDPNAKDMTGELYA